ncbi:MAG: hypothetical protein WC606_04425 [Candidatus Absconditabacterales bacterium]|jgi:purine-cytosine permease-like protein
MDTSETLLKQAKNRFKFGIFYFIIVVVNCLWAIFGERLVENYATFWQIRGILFLILLIVVIINLIIASIAYKKSKARTKEAMKNNQN